MQIEIIAGSPRNPSLSWRVAKYLHTKLNKDWSDDKVGLISLNSITLPFIQQVWTKASDAPKALQPLARRMFKADGFIIVSPEYNGGYSPAMKNLFDHFPKQKNKPFGICTSSDGKMGGMRAAQQILQLVPALFGIASPTLLIVPEAQNKFDEKGKLTDDTFQSMIDSFINDYKWLLDKIV